MQGNLLTITKVTHFGRNRKVANGPTKADILGDNSKQCENFGSVFLFDKEIMIIIRSVQQKAKLEMRFPSFCRTWNIAIYRPCFPNTDHMTIPWFEPLLCSLKDCVRAWKHPNLKENTVLGIVTLSVLAKQNRKAKKVYSANLFSRNIGWKANSPSKQTPFYSNLIIFWTPALTSICTATGTKATF